ncbi:MAG: 1-acyl-sn-glycerol-3-phosphate acyltransferase [Clostridia bacterium]|nr:1-acyl-sn-glycerol-3-phosphate acyltransferase [Clostridia bacterium]MBQ3488146.1 1-acyl-sn-glycerol-3-phosphate acyltransferase [Clostridia bacterium]MBQ6866577.1 1-acyl-sn-glycerol-3-phosphate acyltransferase [Clostridia bacterium]MBQ7754441.1 1-acyl-sn-glycerol-3-phosphate acyltransferase [Clostridia bacterium]MBQ9323279.1 1-acyl-sn-glycerol-3-phosphate acyltransferase [Clostridia bacterium]
MLILYLVLSFGAVLAFARTPLQCPLYFLGTFLGLLLLHALVLAAASLFVNKKDPNPKRFAFYRKLLVTSIGPLLQLGAVQVKLVGEEKLPEGGFLLVGNHRSDFDPITAMYALRGRGVTFVTKKENLDIPVGGRLIAGAGCISLDRADDRQGLVVIRQVVRRIQAGEAMGIYPEGTRSKTGELLPFRVGCFKAAQWAKCPLVVLRTRGTENIGKNFFLRRTPVTLTVAAVFPYEQIRDLDTTEIGELVRSILTDGKEGESKWSA